jgi:hypothetical protein
MARLHTRTWSEIDIANPLGQVPKWIDDSLISVEDMVTDLLTLYLPFWPSTTSFNIATVLTQATPTSVLVPVASVELTGLVGTSVAASWQKAVQQTTVVRAVDGSIAKLVFLDCDSFDSFEAVRATGAAPDLDDIVAEFKDGDNAWASAGDSRPNTFIGSFKTLNEKLRKAYRMT